ncbi:MAG: GIY-YIG nuclease family protein [bacterium]|nr:GIY-YIG nuclease family protein [bacterium]
MQLSSIKKWLNRLPDSPGVYFFIGSPKRKLEKSQGLTSVERRLNLGREILYIGKATSLKDRIKNYFAKDLSETRGPLIVQMIEKAKSISFEKTDSVLEALILEANLIRKHQPYYNTKEKDDKSFNYIVITKEDYPRVLVVRGKDLDVRFPSRYRLFLLGPFPSGGILRDALKIIRKIFPYRDTCAPRSETDLETGRPSEGKRCFNAQIGLCPGVCAGLMKNVEYQKHIKNLILFLEGKKKSVIASFKKEMRQYVKVQSFEKANEVKKRLFALEHIQDIALIKRKIDSNLQLGRFVSKQLGNETSKLGSFPRSSASSLHNSAIRIEAYDVAHLSGKEMVGVMVVVENGLPNKAEYRKFKIKSLNMANDPAALKEILARRLLHPEWPLPNLIVVDGNEVQKKVAENVLAKQKLKIEVVAVVKDKRHKTRAFIGEKQIIKDQKNSILFANSEAHRFAIIYHRLLRGKKFLLK